MTTKLSAGDRVKVTTGPYWEGNAGRTGDVVTSRNGQVYIRWSDSGHLGWASEDRLTVLDVS